MSGRELAVRGERLPVSPVPSSAEWTMILDQADMVSRSGIVPAAYRTVISTSTGEVVQDRRPNVVVAALFGRSFGWDLMTSIRCIHVIEGSPSLRPEAMLAMIRARGHRVSIDREERGVTVTGRRADTGEEYTGRFTFDDAVRAGLCTLDQQGWPRARSEKGKPLPWETYPVDLCQWRAVTQLARGLFSDVVLGAGAEGLDPIVDAEVVAVTETTMPMPAEQPPWPASAPAAETDGNGAAAPQAPPAAAEPEQANPTEPAPAVRTEIAPAIQAEHQAVGGDPVSAAADNLPPQPHQPAQDVPAAPNPSLTSPEAHPAPQAPTAAADAGDQVTAEPETLEDVLARVRAERDTRNKARRGPAVRQVMARAWDALLACYPGWTPQERQDEAMAELVRLGTDPDSAGVGQWTSLAEMWEAQHEQGIRSRWEHDQQQQ